MTVTVRPPTQPPAEPLITVELSYIINVSEGPSQGGGLCWEAGLTSVGAAVVGFVMTRDNTLLTRDRTLLLALQGTTDPHCASWDYSRA